jgi:hypothetical protein
MKRIKQMEEPKESKQMEWAETNQSHEIVETCSRDDIC